MAAYCDSVITPRPYSLDEGMVVRGQVGNIQPWAAGLILVDVGGQPVILPAELERKARAHVGHCAEVLRLEGYTFRRMSQ